MNKPPKYSIIIPTYNGISYLPTCVQTITSQDFNDYELIISDDHSTDGTNEYLLGLTHSQIKIIYPPDSLSMTEHWEWALSHATGEWQIFVGQDDGIQPYFFDLAEILTSKAEEIKLNCIMSSRAYFFWPGCESMYGDIAVGYVAENKTEILSSLLEGSKALLGAQDYFELPQMYTTSLFNKKLLDKVRSKQNGRVFCCHPQDANLAAIVFSLEASYLMSYIPLGWVGTSPKSAGMAISNEIAATETKELKQVYLDKVKNSKLQYHKLAGDFSFGVNALYFWQALLMTEALQKKWIKKKLKSSLFKHLMFSRIFYTKIFCRKKIKNSFDISKYKKLLSLNDCNYLVNLALLVVVIVITFPFSIIKRFINRVKKFFSTKTVKIHIKWPEDENMSMLKASRMTMSAYLAITKKNKDRT